MTTPYTITEDNVFQSAQFVSLTNRARVLFQDLVRTAKRVNRMGLFDPDNSKPFRFHLRHVTGPIDRSQFYEHIRDFHAVGFIDIIPARRPGLAQQIVLNGVYAKLLGQPLPELCGRGLEPTLAEAWSRRPLKHSTLSRTNVNAAFNLLRPSKSSQDRPIVQERRPGYRDAQLDKDLSAIAARIQQSAATTPMTDYAKMKMAEHLQQRAWIGYRSRQDNPRSTAIDPHAVLAKMLPSGPTTSPAPSENWTPPAHTVQERIVRDIIQQTGDRNSLNNWWLLVGRMSQTERAFASLERIVYDFLDDLGRKDPRATAPDCPGAVLNGLLRDECRHLGVDLRPRDAKGPT